MRVGIRYFDRYRTAEDCKIGLVQNAISLSYIFRFTSTFFNLDGTTLGYLKRGWRLSIAMITIFKLVIFYLGRLRPVNDLIKLTDSEVKFDYKYKTM